MKFKLCCFWIHWSDLYAIIHVKYIFCVSVSSARFSAKVRLTRRNAPLCTTFKIVCSPFLKEINFHLFSIERTVRNFSLKPFFFFKFVCISTWNGGMSPWNSPACQFCLRFSIISSPRTCPPVMCVRVCALLLRRPTN